MTSRFYKNLSMIAMGLIVLSYTYSNTWTLEKLSQTFEPTSQACQFQIRNPTIHSRICDFMALTKVKGMCWYDYGQEGIHDPNDRGISDLMVFLLDENDVIFDSTKTNALGQYEFSKIAGNHKYRLFVKVGDNYSFTIKDGTGYEYNDSDVDYDGRSDLFSLPDNDSLVIDAGLHFNCNITTPSLKLDAISMSCFNGDTISVFAHPLDNPIIPQGYTIKYVLTSGPFQKVIQISEQANFKIHADGIFNIYQMIYNDHSEDYNFFDLSFINFGITKIADLGSTFMKRQICVLISSHPLSFYLDNCIGFSGKVWLDENENGKQDLLESGIGNAMVYLSNDTDEYLDSAKSNGLGIYHFDEINSSFKYKIVVRAVKNHHFTLQHASGSDRDDSDVNQNGKSELLFLSPGSKAVLDAGLVANHKGITSTDNFESNIQAHFKNSGFSKDKPMVLRNQKNQSLILYPNPFQDNIKILLPENDHFIEYSILNSSNTKIKSGILHASHNSIDVTELNSGLYLFQWKSVSTNGTLKIIKI